MKTTGVLIAIAASVAGLVSAVGAQSPEESKKVDLTGRVVILTSEEGEPVGEQPAEIHLGGLVIVEIHDLGSAPVADVKIEANRSYRQLGKVRGVAVEDGKPLAGGGYTWCLMQAVTKAESAPIEVSYNGAPHTCGGTHTVKYSVTIKAAEGDE